MNQAAVCTDAVMCPLFCVAKLQCYLRQSELRYIQYRVVQ